MKIILVFIVFCFLLFNCSSCTSKSNDQNDNDPTKRKSIYFKYDSSGKPMYFISEKIVPNSIWREKLGKALVAIYIGREWWSENKKTFKEAGSAGVKVLIEASSVIENDDGTAASVLQQIGPAGCDAMIKSLKETIAGKGDPDIYFIKELGECGQKNAGGVLLAILNNADYSPDLKVTAATALAKLGDYSGLNVLEKIKNDKRVNTQWIDKEIEKNEKIKKEKNR
jgi:hypothetical protein